MTAAAIGHRTTEMNAIGGSLPVFVALLLLGWMWGFWGMLLGIPFILAARHLRRHASRMAAFRMDRAHEA